MNEVSSAVFWGIINKYKLDVCVFSDWDNTGELMTASFKFRDGSLFGTIEEFRKKDVIYPTFKKYSISNIYLEKYKL